MVSDAPIEELDLSVRTYNVLRRNGLRTVSAIVSLTWQELKQKTKIPDFMMDEIIIQLDQAGFSLLNSQNDFYVTSNERVKSIQRQIRLSKSTTFRLEFLPPDHGSYTKGGDGYTIYFNIYNLTSEPIKLSLSESGVFADNRQWMSDYNYTGHTLSEEYVFPTIPRTVGQIFLTGNASYDRLKKDDYYTVSFKCNLTNTLYFYKYLFLGNGQWEFYDYYQVEN